QNPVGPVERAWLWYRQVGKRDLRQDRGRRNGAQHAAMHRYEARAKALETGKILIAARLVDLPLAAQWRLDRHDRDAARLLGAVTTALAYGFIDENSRGRVGIAAALAATTLLGRAGLIVNEDGESRDGAKLALHGIQPVAVVDVDAFGEFGAAIFTRLVGDDHHFLCAFGQDLLRDLQHGWPAFHGLSSGHGNSIVVEDLVRNVDASRRGGADRG